MSSIKVPPLGESIVEATISRWLKNEGDTVAAGDTLVELETDKITVEVPAVTAGVLVRRLKLEGDVVAVGADLGEITDGTTASAPPAPAAGHPAAPAAAPSASQPAAPVAAPSADQPAAPAAASSADQPAAPVAASAADQPAAPVAASAVPASGPTLITASAEVSAPEDVTAAGARAVPGTATPDGQPAKIAPAANRLAAEEHVDLSIVTGTGRGGVVSKTDVMTSMASPAPAAASPPASAAPAAAPAAPAPPASAAPASSASASPRETREKMSTRRKRIAENLLLSQHATAHLTTFNEIDMTAISALRERLKERVEKDQGVKLSFMPFFVKAVCQALKAFPAVNAQIDGDTFVYKHYVNMGIAVAAEGGLVVPSVKDADRKSVVEIGKDIVALAKKARDGKLTMDDLMGGTFTITNGGVFGSLVSTPIINYPQTGILGLHKTQDRPVAIDGKVEIRPMMYIALSYDHRMIDGQQAVLFLVRVKELMEDPAAMLL